MVFSNLDNAIAFALQGNIVLALEIGSAYTIQVALLQIPGLLFFYTALVGYSALFMGTSSTATDSTYPGSQLYGLIYSFFSKHQEKAATPFTLVFPRLDLYSVIMSVFLLSYIYIEGKSNYFKGSMLILAYVVLLSAFWFAPVNSIAS